MLRVNHLSQSFKSRKILKDVSFSVAPEQIVAFLGPNGAGKTTLLRTVMGLLPSPPFNAETNINTLYFNNELINSWPVAKRVSNGLIYLPQQPSLFLQLSALDNLKLVYQHHDYWRKGFAHKTDEALPTSWAQFEEEMYTWLEKTDITNSLNLLAGHLSGGQKRKLEVVRCLLMHPRLIMFDEPFAGVDPKSIYELKSIFTDLKAAQIGIVISDHHVDQLLSIADHINVVINGEIAASGGIKAIMSDEFTKESYLGGQFYEEIAKRYL